MIGKRSIFVHGGLVVASAALALFVWTRDKSPKAFAATDVTVWPGRPADVERITYESKKKRVELSAKKDALGRYFVGTVEKEKTPLKPPEPDAGAPQDMPAANEKVVTGLVSVTPAEKLLELIAPLKAIRQVGQVPADREPEFGLSEPEGTLTVKTKDAERKLLFGGATPGGGDRYARDPVSGEVFVVRSEIFRDVDTAESTLIEHELHEWKDADVTSAKLVAGGKSRTVVRSGPEGKRFWADEAAKDAQDETLGNWMSKLDRLRPTEFPQATPDPHETVVRVEYASGNAQLGYLELIRGPVGEGGKPQYFVVTERTRLAGKVANTAAEQVEQDLGTIVK
jgi:hypothetical protein